MKRERTITITVTDEELTQAQALAEQAGMPMTYMFRAWLKERAKRAKL